MYFHSHSVPWLSHLTTGLSTCRSFTTFTLLVDAGGAGLDHRADSKLDGSASVIHLSAIFPPHQPTPTCHLPQPPVQTSAWRSIATARWRLSIGPLLQLAILRTRTGRTWGPGQSGAKTTSQCRDRVRNVVAPQYSDDSPRHWARRGCPSGPPPSHSGRDFHCPRSQDGSHSLGPMASLVTSCGTESSSSTLATFRYSFGWL